MSSLPISWDIVVSTINNSSRKEELACDYVRNLILSESIRRKESGESLGESYHSGNRGGEDNKRVMPSIGGRSAGAEVS